MVERALGARSTVLRITVDLRRCGLTNFDATSLIQLETPRFFCERCYAILETMEAVRDEDEVLWCFRCPVCGLKYLPSEEHPHPYYWSKYLVDNKLSLTYEAPLEHCRRLGITAYLGRQYLHESPDEEGNRPGLTPLTALYSLLSQARYFVHFVTYGTVSHQLIGALRVTAQRVPIRGIVSVPSKADTSDRSLE